MSVSNAVMAGKKVSEMENVKVKTFDEIMREKKQKKLEVSRPAVAAVSSHAESTPSSHVETSSRSSSQVVLRSLSIPLKALPAKSGWKSTTRKPGPKSRTTASLDISLEAPSFDDPNPIQQLSSTSDANSAGQSPNQDDPLEDYTELSETSDMLSVDYSDVPLGGSHDDDSLDELISIHAEDTFEEEDDFDGPSAGHRLSGPWSSRRRLTKRRPIKFAEKGRETEELKEIQNDSQRRNPHVAGDLDESGSHERSWQDERNEKVQESTNFFQLPKGKPSPVKDSNFKVPFASRSRKAKKTWGGFGANQRGKGNRGKRGKAPNIPTCSNPAFSLSNLGPGILNLPALGGPGLLDLQSLQNKASTLAAIYTQQIMNNPLVSGRFPEAQLQHLPVLPTRNQDNLDFRRESARIQEWDHGRTSARSQEWDQGRESARIQDWDQGRESARIQEWDQGRESTRGTGWNPGRESARGQGWDKGRGSARGQGWDKGRENAKGQGWDKGREGPRGQGWNQGRESTRGIPSLMGRISPPLHEPPSIGPKFHGQQPLSRSHAPPHREHDFTMGTENRPPPSRKRRSDDTEELDGKVQIQGDVDDKPLPNSVEQKKPVKCPPGYCWTQLQIGKCNFKYCKFIHIPEEGCVHYKETGELNIQGSRNKSEEKAPPEDDVKYRLHEAQVRKEQLEKKQNYESLAKAVTDALNERNLGEACKLLEKINQLSPTSELQYVRLLERALFLCGEHDVNLDLAAQVACKVFDMIGMSRKKYTRHDYTTLIRTLCRTGQYIRAYEILKEMKESNVSPTHEVFLDLIQSSKSDPEWAFGLLVEVRTLGLFRSSICSALILLGCRCGKTQLQKTWSLFLEMAENSIKASKESFTSLIKLLTDSDEPDKLLVAVKKNEDPSIIIPSESWKVVIKHAKEKADLVTTVVEILGKSAENSDPGLDNETWNILLSYCCTGKFNKVYQTQQVQILMNKFNIPLTSQGYNSLLCSLSKANLCAQAMEVFQSLQNDTKVNKAPKAHGQGIKTLLNALQRTGKKEDSDSVALYMVNAGMVEVDEKKILSIGQAPSISYVPYGNRFCRYFASGYCRNGDQCSFIHVNEGLNTAPSIALHPESNTNSMGNPNSELEIPQGIPVSVGANPFVLPVHQPPSKGPFVLKGPIRGQGAFGFLGASQRLGPPNNVGPDPMGPFAVSPTSPFRLGPKQVSLFATSTPVVRAMASNDPSAKPAALHFGMPRHSLDIGASAPSGVNGRGTQSAPVVSASTERDGFQFPTNTSIQFYKPRIVKAAQECDWEELARLYVEMKRTEVPIGNEMVYMFFLAFTTDASENIGEALSSFVAVIEIQLENPEKDTSSSPSEVLDADDHLLIGQLGVALMQVCYAGQRWEEGYIVLHTMHQYSINYSQYAADFLPNQTPLSAPTIALVAVEICLELENPQFEGALEVLRGSNYTLPGEGYFLSSGEADIRRAIFEKLVAYFLAKGSLKEARELLLNIGDKDVFGVTHIKYLYNELLRAYIRLEEIDDASEFMKKMEIEYITRDSDVLRALTTGLAGKGRLSAAKELFNSSCYQGVYPRFPTGDQLWKVIVWTSFSKFEIQFYLERHMQLLNSHVEKQRVESQMPYDDKHFQALRIMALDEGNQQYTISEKNAKEMQEVIIAILSSDFNPPLSCGMSDKVGEVIVNPRSLRRWFLANPTSGRHRGNSFLAVAVEEDEDHHRNVIASYLQPGMTIRVDRSEQQPGGNAVQNERAVAFFQEQAVQDKKAIRERVAHTICGHLTRYLRQGKLASRDDFRRYARKLTQEFLKSYSIEELELHRNYKEVRARIVEFVDKFFEEQTISSVSRNRKF